MKRDKIIERGIVVFCNWLVFGLIGIGFTLEGGTRDSLLVGLIGVGSIAAGFIGHIIINNIFSHTFTAGEAALGLVLFAFGTIIFIASWMTGGLSLQDFSIGLAMLGMIVVGFFAYASTRYGLGGAFRKYDVVTTSKSGHQE